MSKYLEDDYYPGQLTDGFVDIVSDSVDPANDEEFHDFQDRVTKYLQSASEIIAILVKSGKVQIASDELKAFQSSVGHVHLDFISTIILEDGEDQHTKKQVENAKFLLSETKNIYSDLIGVAFHEFNRRNLDMELFDTISHFYIKPIENPKTEKERLTIKQQIILLAELGFFSLEGIKDLTTERKGELVSLLLGTGKKNTTEFIRNLSTPKKSVSKDEYFVQTDENKKRVSEILAKLGLKKL